MELFQKTTESIKKEEKALVVSMNRGGDSYQKVGGLIAQLYAAKGSA